MSYSLFRFSNGNGTTIVDCLAKSAHFLSVKKKSTLEQLVEVYVKEVVRLHGVPKFIISYLDTIFTSYFWKCVQEALGTKLNYSTTFHPQTDRKTE